MQTWRLPRPTIRLRLTLLYGAIFLISGAALLAVTYSLVSANSTPSVRTGPDGQILVTYSNGLPAGLQVDSGFSTGAGAVALDPGQLEAVVVGQHQAELNQLVIWSIVALGLMAVASIGFGWVVAGRVLDPLRAMTSTVRQISASNLHRRVARQGPDDEIKDLGNTFDDLLERLEESFEAQRQFVANASHELRTPLARQKTLLQVALADPDATVDSLRAACTRVLAAEAQQEKLIDALLTLARSERGLAERADVDMAAVAARALEARRADLQAAGVTAIADLRPARTLGDQRLLERLVANLLDNATRYNEPGGRIEVLTDMRAGPAILRVSNTGQLVAPGDVARLFEPFRRLGTDRTGRGDGWGLGLSIVRAIAEAHGARLNATAGPQGGLVVEVAFAPR